MGDCDVEFDALVDEIFDAVAGGDGFGTGLLEEGGAVQGVMVEGEAEGVEEEHEAWKCGAVDCERVVDVAQ